MKWTPRYFGRIRHRARVRSAGESARFEALEVRALLATVPTIEIQPAAAIGGLAPDFQLLDVNANSSTYLAQVSPRDYLEQVSGWYFIHST